MDKDSFILRKIRKNSRNKIAKIAREINLPVTTAHMKFKTLEKDFIKRYVAIADFEKLGYTRMIVIIEDNSNIQINEENLNNMYRTSKGITLDLIFEKEKQAQDFLRILSEKRIKYSNYNVLETLKVEDVII